jgi:tetrahydromethanopterin S-methyltransferase subunit A
VEKIPVFHAGQALQSLFKYGIDKEKRIINAMAIILFCAIWQQEKLINFRAD